MNFKKRIREIRKQIKKSKKPIMLFDRDADGVTSYLQLKNKYDKIIGFPLTKDLEKQKRLISNLDSDTDLILIFDIPYLEEEFLETIKDKNIIWVDHHLTNSKKLIEKYEILHLNPLNYDKEDNRPVTYLTYLIANYKKNLPYVAIGSISDFFLLDIIIKFYKFDKKIFEQTINITKEKRKEIFKFIKKYKFNDKDSNDKRSQYIKYLTYEANVIKLKNFFDLLFKLDTEEEIIETIRILEKLTVEELIQNLNNKRTKLYKTYDDNITFRRTEYMAVKIAVLDKDPVIAANFKAGVQIADFT
jgi:single-stranded DNA-specific DHH superfamily exonuclease